MVSGPRADGGEERKGVGEEKGGEAAGERETGALFGRRAAIAWAVPVGDHVVGRQCLRGGKER